MGSERGLWAAVIQVAIEDARGNTTGLAGATADNERRKARIWLTKPNRDFNEVCYLAGLDPEAVRDRCQRMFPQIDEAECDPGVVKDFEASKGTGGGPTTQDISEIEFSQ